MVRVVLGDVLEDDDVPFLNEDNTMALYEARRGIIPRLTYGNLAEANVEGALRFVGGRHGYVHRRIPGGRRIQGLPYPVMPRMRGRGVRFDDMGEFEDPEDRFFTEEQIEAMRRIRQYEYLQTNPHQIDPAPNPGRAPNYRRLHAGERTRRRLFRPENTCPPPSTTQ